MRPLRWARLVIRDAWEAMTRTRPPMRPPHLFNEEVGGGDFVAVGEHLAKLAIEAGALQPNERILDVGCGAGRLAVPLTRFLTTGSYHGFDVSRRAIEWCRREITSQHRNFTFDHADVWSEHYNPHGVVRPEKFRFPVRSFSIDLAFLASILTHMRPDAAAQYVAETARVLKPGGRALMTFFLLDDEVRTLLAAGKCDVAFNTFPEPWWAVQNPFDYEAAIAVDFNVVREAMRQRGLEVAKVSRGAWSLHPGALTYQDIVVAVRS